LEIYFSFFGFFFSLGVGGELLFLPNSFIVGVSIVRMKNCDREISKVLQICCNKLGYIISNVSFYERGGAIGVLTILSLNL